jgi:glycosyltransferase involved in cell wall biosynthesis
MKVLKKIYREIFIGLGFLGGLIKRYSLPSDYIFFLPDYKLGGSEKVHADIIDIVKNKNPYIIFYYPSDKGELYEEFISKGSILNIGKLNGTLFYFTLGKIIYALKNKKSGIFFGMNNALFYSVIKKIKNPNINYFDITHNQSVTKLTKNDYKFICKILKTRIVIDPKSFNDMIETYKKYKLEKNIPQIMLINNKVYIPNKIEKKFNECIKICYAGRGDSEKRLYLLGKIAKVVRGKDKSIEFYVIGNCFDAIEQEDKIFVNNLGVIKDRKELSNIFMDMHFFLLTSNSEGFPLSIMESMAYGVIPISTTIGGIPYHINHNKNGLLLKGTSDKDIINEATNLILNIASDRKKIVELSKNAAEYAKLNFSEEKFNSEYKNILLSADYIN